MARTGLVVALAVWVLAAGAAAAQTLTFATVERPPFAMRDNAGGVEGFSIDLMRAVSQELGSEIEFEVVDTFAEMLAAVVEGRADGAVANISITAEREQVMDFSQPIFDAGIQIMVPSGTSGGSSVLSAIMRWEVAAAAVGAFLFLMAGGLVMWLFERGRQEYFNRPAREAMFPAFWWALNLVVNGGFEERIPRSIAGRIFAVFLVVSSLFVVSIFVAHITAAITVQAITRSVENLSDLEGRRVATTAGSTASEFLAARDIPHQTFDDFAGVIEAFEDGKLDAVVFDGPVLAYYVQTRAQGEAELIDRVFRRESYGIALPQGSPLTEELNRALLTLREQGEHDKITRKWFGQVR